jgi:hypothetical protein
MLTGQRPVVRRRTQRRRAARISVALAIPVALGVTLGVAFTVMSHDSTDLSQSAFGRHHGPVASPTASAPAAGGPTASPSGSATASPTASATSTGGTGTGTGATGTGTGATVPPANSFATGAIATTQLGDLATAPVDGTGAAISLKQTAAQAANSLNCSLAVPASPLSAAGLATPWQLGDGCSMANAGDEGAFVEATILAPNGSLQVYNPLVITAGTKAAVAPTAPKIAAGSTVIVDVGFNGTNLVLTGAGARAGNCVDASGQSVIGQVSACNAVAFYRAANAAIARGTLKVPAAGTASDGQACQTTRDFATIDQDQSDNVVSEYLIDGNGNTAQANAANAATLAGATPLANGSDDALLSDFIDPANGCTSFTAPDPTSPAGTSPSQALNELSAQVNQKGTIAVVPPNDEMTLIGGNMSLAKTNVYRSLVDQPLLANGTNLATVSASYCQNMVNIAPARNQLDLAKDTAFATPVADTGTNLASFLGNRLSMSFTNLNCGDFGLTDPATPTLDGNGVATAVTYSLAQQAAKGAGTTTTTGTNPKAGQNSGSQSRGPRRGRWQNPSGT